MYSFPADFNANNLKNKIKCDIQAGIRALIYKVSKCLQCGIGGFALYPIEEKELEEMEKEFTERGFKITKINKTISEKNWAKLKIEIETIYIRNTKTPNGIDFEMLINIPLLEHINQFLDNKTRKNEVNDDIVLNLYKLEFIDNK
jgi:hypothetical protein